MHRFSFCVLHKKEYPALYQEGLYQNVVRENSLSTLRGLKDELFVNIPNDVFIEVSPK